MTWISAHFPWQQHELAKVGRKGLARLSNDEVKSTQTLSSNFTFFRKNLTFPVVMDEEKNDVDPVHQLYISLVAFPPAVFSCD